MYNLILTYINFIKLGMLFKITKLSILTTTLITLNKLKINYIIVILIILSLSKFINYKILHYIVFYIVIKIKIKYIYFLNFFFFGIFKIHPVLFYLSLILYINIHIYNFVSFKVRLISVLNYSVISLVLGGVWALYQLNWGYYWSSDPIEFSLAMIIIVYIKILHSTTQTKFYQHLNFLFVLLYIYMIRSNYIYTRHNFFNSSKFLLKIIRIILLFSIMYMFRFNTNKNYIANARISTILLLSVTPVLLCNWSFNPVIKKLLSTSSTCIIFFFYLLFGIRWYT